MMLVVEIMANVLVVGTLLRLPPAVVPSSMDEHLLQSSITISQAGLYSVSVPASACLFVVMPIYAC
jgi:hypothetical protein